MQGSDYNPFKSDMEFSSKYYTVTSGKINYGDYFIHIKMKPAITYSFKLYVRIYSVDAKSKCIALD